MWLWPPATGMRATESPNEQFVSPAAYTTVSIAILAGVFGLLVAAANPGTAAAFAVGGLATVAGTRGAALVRRSDGVCVPGTGICLRSSAA